MRPRKNIVDYFPHTTVHGKTMFILESRYGNNGYAFWFKLLEKLGKTENHFIDLRDEIDLEYLAAEMKFPAEEMDNILKLLARLDAIDKKLWAEKIIWCQKFVDGVADAYRKRKTTEVPKAPYYLLIPTETEFPAEETPKKAEETRKGDERKGNYTKGKETKGEEIEKIPPLEIIDLWKYKFKVRRMENSALC